MPCSAACDGPRGFSLLLSLMTSLAPLEMKATGSVCGSFHSSAANASLPLAAMRGAAASPALVRPSMRVNERRESVMELPLVTDDTRWPAGFPIPHRHLDRKSVV